VGVKAPLALLDAVERAHVPWRAALLGDGPLRGRVVRAVARRGLLGRVLVPGPVEDPAAWIVASRALVLTSTSEGTPLSVLEGFALGRPAVVPTVGGLPDLVVHGGNGRWVPPADASALAAALDRLAADPEEAARLGAQARRDAEAYGADALAERTAALYADVLAG
jgi:glycosyltransferase involved in cell wall biosynthesis